MNQQEYKKTSIDGVEKIGEGALQMIGALEKMIKASYGNMNENEAIKLAEVMKEMKMDVRVKEFQKQIKELQKDLK